MRDGHGGWATHLETRELDQLLVVAPVLGAAGRRAPVARLEPRALHPQGLVFALQLLHAGDVLGGRDGRPAAPGCHPERRRRRRARPGPGRRRLMMRRCAGRASRCAR